MKVIKTQRENGTWKYSYEYEGPVRTKQEFKKECDINNIMTKFRKTGKLPDYIKQNPIYGDFTDAENYIESLNTVVKAQQQFELQSSEVRNKFKNDVALFLDYINDVNNKAEAEDLQIIPKGEVVVKNDEKTNENDV